MDKQRLEIRTILLVIVIAEYGIATGAASTEQSPMSLHEAAKAGKTAQLEAKVSSLEARLHKERHEFSKMGQNNYKIFQVEGDDLSILSTGILSTVYGKGDVNNDGFNDILINEPEWSGLRGRAFLFYGGKDIDFSSPDMIFEGEKEGDGFGGQAGVFADINNDGNDDVIIGASGNSTDPINRRVYVFYCGPDMDTEADIILDSGVDEGGRFGYTVTAADIDNDGYNDVLVGSQYHNQRIGGVYLFWGGKTMDTIVDIVFEGEAYSDAAPILSPGTGWMV